MTDDARVADTSVMGNTLETFQLGCMAAPNKARLTDGRIMKPFA